ncbi:MAG: GDYXXLXY domain-containing protein [Elusimicrobiales bacterium]|nr:GDYXXLXY domain-containing protein [Elusimicrobiales bacterium]
MSKLRIVLAVQLLFFVAWGGWLLSSRNADSPEFYLETTPVDPRDLISGTYVALSYAISTPTAGNCPSFTNYGPVFVKLAPLGKTINTENGTVPVYEATDCSKNPPQEFGWVSAKLQYGFRGNMAVYGIEKHFVNEDNPLKDARSGSVAAKVKIGHNRSLVLLDLVKKI